jgi:hypothetical protein
MKHIVAATLLAVASLMAHTGASAQNKLQATIPFDFAVGNSRLPAGTYVIDHIRPNEIMLSNLQTNKRVFAMPTSTDEVRQSPNRVIFNKYGDQYFLREIRGMDGQTAWNLGPSKLEKQVQVQEASRADQQKALIALK